MVTLLRSNSGVSYSGQVVISYINPDADIVNIGPFGTTILASNLAGRRGAFTGGTLQLNETAATYTQSFTVDSTATNTINQYGNITVFSGIISNVSGQMGRLIIGNSLTGGSVTFTGENIYTGLTTVNSGATLQLGNGGTSGSVIGNITNNGSLIFNRSNDVTYAGVMSGSGSLTKLGGGVLTLTGVNSYTGGTTVTAGTLIGNTASLQGNIVNNSAVTFSQSTDGTYAGVMSGSGSLTKLGGGVLTLTGVNSYTGGTTVTAGTLKAGAANTLPMMTALTIASGSVFDLNGYNQSFGSIAGAGNTTLGSATLTVGNDNNSTSYSGVLSGTGGLTKVGTGILTLAGSNTYTGGTTIAAGTLVGNTTSLQGAIVNNAAVTFDQATDGAYAGVMSGTGSLAKIGPGSLTLTGANTYSGGTTVAAGSLIGNATSLQGVIVNNAAVTFDQATAGTYADVMSGTGSVMKTGVGKLNMTGVNTYAGPTTVKAGILAVNGSLVSAVLVEDGAALQGVGSFGGGLIGAGAFLAPGNSIGTITSNGNLTFASGSTYAVEVDAAGSSDKTVANGSATLQGGTVVVTGSLSSTPLALSKTRYTILTATNGVSGKFAGVTGLPTFSFLTGGLTYGPNDVTLGYSLSTSFSVAGKNINQRNVGNALTLAALGPVNALSAPILNALFLGNYQNAQAVMDTVSGSGLAGVQSTAMQVGEMASSSISDQIAFWRSGETLDATGVSSQEDSTPRGYMSYAPLEKSIGAQNPIQLKDDGKLTAAVAPRTFRAWGSMFGGGANYLSDIGRGSAASNLGYYGGLIGVDYQVQPNLLVGVAVGGSTANFSVGSLSTSGNLTGFHAGVYGAYNIGASYIALNETFSTYSNQTSRKAGGYALMPYEQLSAGFGSTEFRTRLEVGHSLMMGGLKATPFVAAEYAAYRSSAFTEQNSLTPVSTFALANNGQAISSLPTFVGLRLSNGYTLANGWRLAPTGSVAYVHEFFPQRQFTNILLSMPGADFNVSGPRSTYNLVQTKLGAQLNLTNQFALFTDFQGEFSSMSQSYGGKAGMRLWW